MRKKLKKLKQAFIPHEENGYTPTLFHYASMSAILIVGIIFFISSLAARSYVVTTDQGAAVYSSVLVDLTNKARQENNVPTLAVSETLTKAAQMKADDMATRQYFSHTSPDGTTPWYWFQKSGYEFMYAGENLAIDFTESSDIESAWLASPKHRENIIDGRFTEIGIAAKTAMWQGKETTFVVQLFGRPSRAIATVAPETTTTPLSPQDNPTVPTVAGVANPPAKNLTVISESPETVIVKNTDALPSINLTADSSAPQAAKADAVQKAIVSIPSISSYALTALSLIVLLGLILFVFIEIRRQHPKHVLVGIFAFFVLTSLAYLSNALTLPL